MFIGFVHDAGVEVAEKQLGEICGILGGLRHYHLRLLCLSNGGNVVQMGVEREGVG